MTVAYASSGAVASSAVGAVDTPATNNISVPYPASIVAGDGLILARAAKPQTGTLAFTTPAGWTLVHEMTGGTPVFPPLSDTSGHFRAAIYFKEAVGTEAGSLDLTGTINDVNVQQAVMSRYTRAAGTTWSVAASSGADITANLPWIVDAATDIGFTNGDMAHVATAWGTDSARIWSADALAAAGTTFVFGVEAASGLTAVNADMACRFVNFNCTAGPSTAPATYSATLNSATNMLGVSTIMRLREVAAAGSRADFGKPGGTLADAAPATSALGIVADADPGVALPDGASAVSSRGLASALVVDGALPGGVRAASAFGLASTATGGVFPGATTADSKLVANLADAGKASVAFPGGTPALSALRLPFILGPAAVTVDVASPRVGVDVAPVLVRLNVAPRVVVV
jgi:hypothetical protein